MIGGWQQGIAFISEAFSEKAGPHLRPDVFPIMNMATFKLVFGAIDGVERWLVQGFKGLFVERCQRGQ